MANRKWLSIVVDGSTAMGPFWRKIVSEYLVNIVRSFFGNPRGEGVYRNCEVGLIIYNTGPSIGRNVQYINWTNNMEQFLALLPFLSFQGHSLNHTAAEGLAEALGCERHCILVATGEPVAERMLVPLPRVHQGKFIHGQIRILLANFLDVAKMFVPLRISLSVITPRLHPHFVSIFNEGNSLEKSTPIMDYGNGNLFSPSSMNVGQPSLNIGQPILNIGQPSLNIRQPSLNIRQQSMNMGQPSIQGFQNVRHESASKLPLDVSQATPNVMNAPPAGCFVPMNSFEEIMSLLSDDNNNHQEDQISKISKTLEEEDSLAYIFQLDQPISLEELLGQDQPLSSKTQVGGESSQVLRDIPQSVTRDTTSTTQLTSNSSEMMNISISPGIVVSNACTSIVGEGSSNGLAQELGGSIFSSENCLNSSSSLPQNNPKCWPAGSNALYPSQAAASLGDSIFLNTTGNSVTQFESPSFPVHQYGYPSTNVITSSGTGSLYGNALTQFLSPNSPVGPYDWPSVGPNGSGIVGDGAGASSLLGNSISQFQSPSSPLHPYGSASSGGIACASASTDAIVVSSAANANANAHATAYGNHQQFARQHQFEMSGIDPLGVPSAIVANPLASPAAMVPQYNQTQVFPRQPSTDFKDFVPAWEGYLVGNIHPFCAFFNQAQAWRKQTSPGTLTYNWSTTLEIGLYVPRKAVMHTMRTYGGVLDDVFFEVTQFDNLDLYYHLMSNNLCAKISLPSHTLMLSTTDSKHCYLGSIFPGVKPKQPRVMEKRLKELLKREGMTSEEEKETDHDRAATSLVISSAVFSFRCTEN
ncbi:unnamed protein product [Sphenostylis stenocarpa]|uniref:Mediator of RNA polymerase II transcription subunit 25 n=1 Tax=Sphenostylis stenocarpa TaxID=92480 RepID=A0AA86SGN3_9FABA|nr:unnamed protein product [Sphenostylis stenocarpa]